MLPERESAVRLGRRNDDDFRLAVDTALSRLYQSPALRERFKLLGAIANPGTPEDFAAFVTKERPKWVSMVKLSGVQPE